MIDLLNITPNVISKDIREKYILLSGAPKIGKTEFCTQSPHALILAFELGTNARPGAMVQPIQKWSEFKMVLRQLATDEVKAKFETICIDTVGIAYDLCEAYICQQNGVQKIGDIPYGQGYTALSKEFENSLRAITHMGYGLIMTCHLKEVDNADGEIVECKPDLNNRCLKIVNGLVDIICVITQTWNDKGESERWVQTRSTPTIVAGSRFRFLEPTIPFGYNEFVNALAKAIEMEEEHGAVVVDKKERTNVEVLDYNKVRARALELWNQLVGTDENINEDMARIILKKAEIIFGHAIKLSEINEDQVDLFQLVVLEMEDLMKK